MCTPVESRKNFARRVASCCAEHPRGTHLVAIVVFLIMHQSAQAECGPGAGNCCSLPGNNTPGCEDEQCCEIVCDIDPTCCDEEGVWSAACSGLAREHCPICHVNCGIPEAGDCCDATDSPGCDNEECCTAVCICDPFCCAVQWDWFCAHQGFDADCLCGPGMCGGANTPECAYCQDLPLCPTDASGDCCTPNGSPGCEGTACCETVCAEDPFCCNTEWDFLCANAALLVCPECTPGPHCGDPTLGDCCEANETTHCEDEECCETVCAVDPFCCEVAWDGICADFAHDLCPELCPTGPTVCGHPKSGDCCFFDGPPGCYDKQCCEAVCAQDPFCCEVAWDRGCVMIVIESPQCPGSCIIELCPHDASGDCCMGHGGLGCEDDACCESVCSMDPFCCEVEWDDICADHAHQECDICGDPEGCSLGFWKNHTEHWVGYSPDEIFDEVFIVTAGIDTNCCEPHGGTGCDDPACEEQICAQDPFCCDVQWDAICANDASAMCEVCMIVDPAPLDVFGEATLHEVISSRSGGPNAQGPTPHHNNLGKQAVAALLNAASSASYPWTENEVIDVVTEAFLARDPEAMNALKDELDDLNNLGCPSFDPADITGPNGEPDGVVDVHDLLEVLNHWGAVDDAQPADLNGDGVVNSTDLIMLLNNWGETHPQWTEFE